MKFVPLYFRFYLLILMIVFCARNTAWSQEDKLFKPVIGIKVFNPWADASLIYPIYKGSLSISPTYGFEYTTKKDHIGFDFRQHHYVSIIPYNSFYSDIALYRRTTSVGSYYEFDNNLRISITLLAFYVHDPLTSVANIPNHDWGIGWTVSKKLSGIRFEVRHEPQFYNGTILEGDKYSLNLLYNLRRHNSDSVKSNKLFRFLIGGRTSLNRHFRDNRNDFNILCNQIEVGLQMKVPKTDFTVDLRNTTWFSIAGGMGTRSINGRLNLVSIGIVYAIPVDKPIGVGLEHFWLTDHTYGLMFPYNKIDFYPESGIGIYLSGKINEHFMIEARQQYAYHINTQLSNIVKPIDEYRFSIGLYYTFRP